MLTVDELAFYSGLALVGILVFAMGAVAGVAMVGRRARWQAAGLKVNVEELRAALAIAEGERGALAEELRGALAAAGAGWQGQKA